MNFKKNFHIKINGKNTLNYIGHLKLESIKITATKTGAEFVKNPDREHIIPSAFDEGVANAVAESVKKV